MTKLTDKQQALLEELLKDFSGNAKDIFGEGSAQDHRQAHARGGDDPSPRIPTARSIGSQQRQFS